LSLIGHAPLLKTNSEVLINRFRITSFPQLIVLRDGKASYYTALSPRDMRDHRRLLSWMKSVWLPMVPELSAANSHEVMQGRTVVLAILDRTLKDFEQTKQKMKVAALEWLDVRAGEDKAEKQQLREKKESKIEQAEEKGDKKAIEKAKGIQVVVKPKKEVGFAWVDGVFWGRWSRGTYGIDVRETGPRIIINEQDVLPDSSNWTDVLGKEILGYQSSR
jgi:protein disulfide-isomerase